MDPTPAKRVVNARRGLVAVLLFLLGIVIALPARERGGLLLPMVPAVVVAAPNVFGGPVNGGCYLDTATTCKLHIDSWQPILIDPGERLVAIQLQADGQPLYDFRTDESNPPTGSYLPSPAKHDFAISCGQPYVLSLLAQDTGDATLVTVGQTNAFNCPQAATPTPTATPTQTATPTASATPQVDERQLWIPWFVR